jgi:hypothetical protein
MAGEATKTVRVSQHQLDELKRRKRDYEDMADVLEREFGIPRIDEGSDRETADSAV